MHGRVDDGGYEATLTLTVLGGRGRHVEVEATIDTGFTGALSLPPNLVEFLSLPFVARGAAVLADGSMIETRVYRARVIWHGRERVTRVLTSGAVRR